MAMAGKRGTPRRIFTFALVVMVGVCLWLGRDLNPALVSEWIGGPGAWSGPIFIGVYAVSTVLFLPGSILALAGGALFGPVWGTLINLIGATLGAGLAFLMARYLGGDWVRARAGARLAAILAGVESEGWRFVAFVRLVPLFPFNLLNYALGLTRISLLPYLVATGICMLPGTLAYTWLGYVGREAASGGEELIRKGLLALGLLVAVAFLPSLIRRWRER
uniref:TVP38/TMEM64 family membrane protein n=1 Tax=Candidatus Kentrum sp. LPFa TaxID=2126335 RepID=A0A450Y2B4_9GAMM|nr:MAG: Uncharacterized membrane protein YdjX, TVP38/TMEM64 family, SNARE-associated domain [Candidatus Kentron sp. LPFa]VFK35683.1 MAG: Uncharacterized membrane protein YdjX, TVP38/TMEM64 family, SNARE-associated domain [Candidatus Kentron sp. LPFa]